MRRSGSTAWLRLAAIAAIAAGCGHDAPSSAPASSGPVRVAILGAPEELARDLQANLVRSITDRTLDVRAFGGEDALDEALRLRPAMVVDVVAVGPTAAWSLAEPSSAEKTASAIATEPWARARDALARRLADELAKGWKPGAVPESRVAQVEARARRCSEVNVPFVAAVLPEPIEADAELRALALDALERERGKRLPAEADFGAVDRVVTALTRKDIPTLDLEPGFRLAITRRKSQIYSLESGGWTREAMRGAASTISEHAAGHARLNG
ncbi:MAG TPA: hypothetical protein VKE69_07080 [Planctomycetota bacterium]|nr:hypothetical protein [Planctomycetota bacterium]